MTKEALKNEISQLGLNPEIEALLFELVDGAQEVNQVLLNTVADILDQQADFYEKTAEILFDEADQYDSLAEEMETIDNDEIVERFEAFSKSQEELIANLDKKMAEFKQQNPEMNPEAGDIRKAQEELAAISSAQEPVASDPMPAVPLPNNPVEGVTSSDQQ